jgi:hypothetical protein
VVAREHAQPPGVDRQVLAQAVLHAEIGHGAEGVRAGGAGEPGRPLHLLMSGCDLLGEVAQEPRVIGQIFQPALRDAFQDQPRVASSIPKLSIHALPKRVGTVVPASAQVER